MQVAYSSLLGVEIDPDTRDTCTNQTGREVTKKFISKYLTGVDTTPSIVEPCIVAVSLYEFCRLCSVDSYNAMLVYVVLMESVHILYRNP